MSPRTQAADMMDAHPAVLRRFYQEERIDAAKQKPNAKAKPKADANKYSVVAEVSEQSADIGSSIGSDLPDLTSSSTDTDDSPDNVSDGNYSPSIDHTEADRRCSFPICEYCITMPAIWTINYDWWDSD